MTPTRRFPKAIASVAACALFGVGLLAHVVFSRPTPRPSPPLPSDPPAGPAIASGQLPENSVIVPETCVQPPAGPGPDEPPPAAAEPTPPVWAGFEDEPPAGPTAPRQQPLPTGIPLQRIADKLGDVFTALKEPPAEPGFARHFQQYTDNLSTKLQLEGDRADLSGVRLMFFDRRADNAADRGAQDDAMVRFLEAVGAGAVTSEVLKTIALASQAGGPHQEKQWDLGANHLVVTITPGYGAGVIDVRRPPPAS